MKYTVNLYRADDKGFLTARACMKSALQLGGHNTRDTRLLSAEMPQWNISPWFAPSPSDEQAITEVREQYIKRVMPDLNNPDVIKAVKENELDLRVIRGILATDEKSYGGLFLQYLMSYPRWVNAKGEVEVGGEDYFSILHELAGAHCKASDAGLPTWKADTSHIAAISTRKHKRVEALAKVAPNNLHEAFAEQEREKRGGIDETSALFFEFVNMVGAKTGCNAAAGTVINAVKKLLGLLDSCGINDFNVLDAACNNTEDALTALDCALATKQDTEVMKELTTSDVTKAQKPKRKRIKHIPYKEALAILERLNCPKDRKTLQRWMSGQNTPEDFTPECMVTVQAFAAWARIYANREQAKINTNNALRIDNPDNRKLERYR